MTGAGDAVLQIWDDRVMALWATILAFYFGGRQFSKQMKPRKRTAPKQCDPSWKLRHALGHKVEASPKAYTRKLKHPKLPNE